ncbi:MAG: hypothetical protein IKD07_01980 [Clostridia bacterium]|nr:hypothetical protein [Clostridia bacterium]
MLRIAQNSLVFAFLRRVQTGDRRVLHRKRRAPTAEAYGSLGAIPKAQKNTALALLHRGDAFRALCGCVCFRVT